MYIRDNKLMFNKWNKFINENRINKQYNNIYRYMKFNDKTISIQIGCHHFFFKSFSRISF